jgi:hypothetical protein
MKKNIFGWLTILVLLAPSCKKSNTNNGGRWKFRSTTFTAMGCVAQPGSGFGYTSSISAGTSTAINNIINISFSTMELPAASASYSVVGNVSPIGNQVNVNLTLGSSLSTGQGGIGYHATGGNGTNQTVNVTVSATGKISVSGSNIMMVNDTLPSDSAALTFNITQTN